MNKKKNKEVKVGNSAKPIHFNLRKEPKLIVGNDYYVSFGMKKAVPCILLNIIDKGEKYLKQVQIGIKDNSQKGYGGINTLYSDEIGLTPEESVVNEHSR